MEAVTSTTSTERLVRAALLTVLVAVFAGLFLWDGLVAYSQDNVRQIVRSLGLPDDMPVTVDKNLTAKHFGDTVESIPVGRSIETVKKTLGEPGLVVDAAVYYFGPGGHVRVETRDDRITSVEWVDGVHTETDLALQRWLGAVLAVGTLLLLANLWRVASTRAVLTGEGLKVRGRPRIPLDAMRGVRDDGKGAIVLTFERDERPAELRLDAYVYKNRDAIVEAICERKGFARPSDRAG